MCTEGRAHPDLDDPAEPDRHLDAKIVEGGDGSAQLILTRKSSAILSLRVVFVALGSLGRDGGRNPKENPMELFNRSEALRRQERILRQAHSMVEAALAQAGALTDLAEQIYLLGATVVPLLRAGHHMVSEGLGTAKAD